jgi:hypothetical protein
VSLRKILKWKKFPDEKIPKILTANNTDDVGDDHVCVCMCVMWAHYLNLMFKNNFFEVSTTRLDVSEAAMKKISSKIFFWNFNFQISFRKKWFPVSWFAELNKNAVFNGKTWWMSVELCQMCSFQGRPLSSCFLSLT